MRMCPYSARRVLALGRTGASALRGRVASRENPFVPVFAFGFSGRDGKLIPGDAEGELQGVQASSEALPAGRSLGQSLAVRNAWSESQGRPCTAMLHAHASWSGTAMPSNWAL
eukprot:15391188-Heterocapsa_arctica.AAC.1